MDWKTWIKKRIEYFTDIRIYRYSLPRGVDFMYDARETLVPEEVSVVFDVGANIGQSAVWFAREYPNATIYCFEPVTSTYKELKRLLIDFRNIVFCRFALGEIPQKSYINVSPGHDSSVNSFINAFPGGGQEIIDVQTLDDYCMSNDISDIDLLKIDVEGYELEVLRGAKYMLTESRIKFLYIESTVHANSDHYFVLLHELDAYLSQFGYDIFGIYEQQIDQKRKLNHLYFFNVAYIQHNLCRPNNLE